MAALRKRVATLTNKPVIHQTATSKARAEFVKSSASTSNGQGFSIKQPLKPGRQHHGIPIILSHQKKTNNDYFYATHDEYEDYNSYLYDDSYEDYDTNGNGLEEI